VHSLARDLSQNERLHARAVPSRVAVAARVRLARAVQAGDTQRRLDSKRIDAGVRGNLGDGEPDSHERRLRIRSAAWAFAETLTAPAAIARLRFEAVRS
jgi:hypothetical protein